MNTELPIIIALFIIVLGIFFVLVILPLIGVYLMLYDDLGVGMVIFFCWEILMWKAIHKVNN
ncbi:hypothetical protein HNP86_000963 [Methanococcus maripaludis]|uniref:Uncharacterized protein n=1 Tax=Methanococcus maripaludis TaxID=39152 RepID=A0A7J9NT48_METMI|nr:hypothetical protein [Methanococcus maripaludis]